MPLGEPCREDRAAGDVTVAVRREREADRVRVYVPATTTVLERLLDQGRLEGPQTVFTVTPQLRGFYQLSDSDEELEYAALIAAARASLRLMDVDPAAARRPGVVAPAV